MENKEGYKYKPTTAFWKIHKLIGEGMKKYKEGQKKVFVIQGGQGASKTVSIIMLFADYILRNRAKVTVCSAQRTKLLDTAYQGFISIIDDWNLPITTYGDSLS